MQARDFCYWLQGFFEINSANKNEITLTRSQIDMIKNHLNLVFAHEIDPAMGNSEHQDKLNKIHFGEKLPNGMVARC